MTLSDDLEASRASLVMINPAPYNAEAPPSALDGDVTPIERVEVLRNGLPLSDVDPRL